MGPQCTRVSRALDRHPEGICAVDFLPPNVIDGGLPITRVAARIHDLIVKHGEQIETAGEKYGCTRYRRPVVVRAPVSPAPPVVVTDPAPATVGRLFDLSPRVAIYDEDAA